MNGNYFEVKELTILPCSTCAGSKVQGGGRTVPSIPTPHKNLGRKPVPNQSAQSIIKPDVLKWNSDTDTILVCYEAVLTVLLLPTQS